MGLTLVDLFVSGLLLANAGAVLNEDRFLARIGWGYEASQMGPPSIKKQIITLLHAMRVLMTLPLMALNLIVIVVKLLLG